MHPIMNAFLVLECVSQLNTKYVDVIKKEQYLYSRSTFMISISFFIPTNPVLISVKITSVKPQNWEIKNRLISNKNRPVAPLASHIPRCPK